MHSSAAFACLLMLNTCRAPVPIRANRAAVESVASATATGSAPASASIEPVTAKLGLPASSRQAKHVYAAGLSKTCAVLDSGELVCSFEPKQGCVTERMQPSGVQSVERSLCALDRSGAAVSLAGNGCELDATSHQLVEAPLENEYGRCALSQDGAVSCTSKRLQRSSQILTKVRQLAGGGSFFCALRVHGDVWCWGTNEQGGLGDGRSHQSQAPVRVRLGKPALSLSVGIHHACVASRDGSVECWGENSRGAVGVGRLPSLGDIPVPGSPPEYLVPQRVAGLPKASQLSTMDSQTCALTEAGEIYCWGQTPRGEPVGRATLVGDLPPAVEFSLGSPACAMTRDGLTFCWGRGCPLSQPSLTPQRVDWRIQD